MPTLGATSSATTYATIATDAAFSAPTFTGAVNIQRGASATSVLTIGDALNHSSLVLNTKATGGFTNTIDYQRAGVSQWMIYDAASPDLYFRNSANNRSHMLLIAGASNDAAYTDIYSMLRVRGHSGMFGATGQVLVGTNGTAEGWLDCSTTLNLRSQGGSGIISLSKHRFDGNVGFYGATPVAKPTGVAVTAAGVHAALVTLGLIAA